MTDKAVAYADSHEPTSGAAARFGLVAFALALVLGALTWLVVVRPDTAMDLDSRLDPSVHSMAVANQWLVDVSLVLRIIGGVVFSGIVVAVVAIALVGAGGSRRPFGSRTYSATFLALSAVGGVAVNTAMKLLVERPRPPWNGLWTYESTWSYPSGHAQGGITVWVALGLVAFIVIPGRLRWVVSVPLVILGLAIGVSRTVLGVHWPSDVLGGWAMGGAWMAASAAIVILAAAAGSRRRSGSDEPGV